MTSWSATGAQAFNRSYTYDALNRLASMSAPGDQCTGLTWTYDAWGNRTDQTATGGTCNTFQQSVNANNQFVSGYQYDADGNITYDGVHNYYYDAENRIIQVDGTIGNCSTATACYLYDAQGRRTQKITGSNNTGYTYDLSGRVNSEWCQPCNGTYTGWGGGYVFLAGRMFAQYTDGTVLFAQTDHLGSTRLLTGYPTPSIGACYDYYPFGEIISCGATGDQSQKFTGYLRDTETNLDDANARYFASSLGLFMSPDPSGLSFADPTDPQTLNLYSYVRNSPLMYTDPTGRDYEACFADGGGCVFFPELGDLQNALQGTDGFVADGSILVNAGGQLLFAGMYTNVGNVLGSVLTGHGLPPGTNFSNFHGGGGGGTGGPSGPQAPTSQKQQCQSQYQQTVSATQSKRTKQFLTFFTAVGVPGDILLGGCFFTEELMVPCMEGVETALGGPSVTAAVAFEHQYNSTVNNARQQMQTCQEAGPGRIQ
ncbi:MAG: RHS repeat domain-containing protein [Candidatus Acidiferrales bacterium]